MATDQNTVNSIFFNHSFDKKRLKALISWVFKQSGEAEALKVIDLLKETGFQHATKAGISIGLHDLATPIQKSWLISESQLAMNTTERDFAGARITAAERSQRIIDTWHRASESLSKQVVDYFGIYDKFNPVYIMALSGARGNFSQVRQLIGMRGLMADQQGKIVNFPIRSNLREGLTLTEYFISCSGARKGLVDTALRTADTGYLTRRLVDVSHHVVVKRIRCNTNRGISFKSLQSYNKTLLPLKERLVGRVLAEDIFCKLKPEQGVAVSDLWGFALPLELRSTASQQIFAPARSSSSRTIIAKKDQEISLKLALKIAEVREKVDLRSPLTCGFTQSVCQLCYGWSISQGSLVSLGDAVGVIAAQSIGEPGTQLTMRTFHTGGVFSGDLLQEIKAPHEGTIEFSRAFQGLLIRTAHGRIAFLSKTQGSLVVNGSELSCRGSQDQQTFTSIPIPAFTMLFVRQGEKVESNQLLAEFSIRTREGNQPIKTEQTIFAELSGRVVEDCTGKVYAKSIKESALFLDSLESNPPSLFEMQEELLVKGLPRVQSETRTFLQGKADFLPSKQKNETTLFRNSFLAYKANLSLSSFTVSKPYVTQVISSFSSYNGCISAQKVNGQGVSFPSFSNKSSCVQIKSANEGHKASLSMTLGGKATRLSGKRFVRIRHQNRTKQRLLKRFVITYGERGLWGFAPNPRQIFALPSKIPKTNLCFAKICKKICKPKAIKYFEANGAKLYKPQSMKIFTSSSYLGLRSTRHQSLDVIPFKRLFRFFCSKHQGKVYGERKNILYKIFSRYCAQLDQINRKKNDLYLDSYKQVVKQRKPSFVVGLPCGFRGASVTSANLLQIEDLYGKALTKLRFVRPCGQRFARRFVRLCPKSQIPNPKPTANLFFTKKSAVGLQQQEIQEDLYPQAKMKILNVVQGVQKKTLQNIFDTKLVRLDRSHNGKRFVFFNEMKKKQSVRCKAQILFLQKSEDLESDTFKYIEPVRSGRLGFLKILSMRVGATLDYASPLLASNPSKKTKKSMSIKASNETNSSFEKSTKRNVSFLKLTDKYLHPEFVKENRFLLQTIAEHGDILEEGYSYNS